MCLRYSGLCEYSNTIFKDIEGRASETVIKVGSSDDAASQLQ